MIQGGKSYIDLLPGKIVVDVQPEIKPLHYTGRYIFRVMVRMVQVNSFPQRIDHYLAVAAVCEVFFDGSTDFFAQFPVNIIGKIYQQILTSRIVLVHRSLLQLNSPDLFAVIAG